MNAELIVFGRRVGRVGNALRAVTEKMWWISVYGTQEYRLYIAAGKGLLAGDCWGAYDKQEEAR